MTTAATLPSPQQAHAVVCDIHKRAFLGRLAQHGEVPQTEKDSFALLDLGISLSNAAPPAGVVKEASDGVYGDGPYAGVLRTFTELHGPSVAPGFEHLKQSSVFSEAAAVAPELPPQLIDDAWGAAHSLSQDPTIYSAAVVKRADNERLMTEAMGQEQPDDAGGEKAAEKTAEAKTEEGTAAAAAEAKTETPTE